MAKSEVIEGGDPVATKVVDMKRELERLVKSITAADNFDGISLEFLDRALEILSYFKEMKIKGPLSLKLLAVPEEYRCPLSKELMRDPVVIATGQTYDRPFIQRWLKDNRTCPRTQEVLSHPILTPNHLIREIILKWCKNNQIQLPDPVENEVVIAAAERDHFISLLMKMSSTLSDKKEAAKELRQLTKRMHSPFRVLFGESLDAIPQLISPLFQNPPCHIPLDLQEDIITTLFNVFLRDSNRKLVAEIPVVIPTLIESFQSGTIETRSNAAAALSALADHVENRTLIGESGAFKPLIGLLEEEHELAMRDAAEAIYKLSTPLENRPRAVRDGAVSVILKRIKSRTLVDVLLPTLDVLSSNKNAVMEIAEIETLKCLLSIMRETSSADIKEKVTSVLHSICYSSDRQSDSAELKKAKELVREEESKYGTISQIAQNGTIRGKRKASRLLERLNK